MTANSQITPPEFVTPAFLESLTALAKKAKKDSVMYGFAGKAETEVILWQTLHASVSNNEKYGLPFSFAAQGLFSSMGNGIVDNDRGFSRATSLAWLVSQKVRADNFAEIPPNVIKDRKGMVTILWLTPKFINDFSCHLNMK